MDDRHKISDTIDIDAILRESHARQAEAPDQPQLDREERYVLNVRPAQTVEESDDYLFYDDQPPRRRESSPASNGSKKPLILTLVIVCALAVVGITGYLLYKGLSDSSSEGSIENSAVADNVNISGVNVGGKTYKDALIALGSVEQRIAGTIRVEVDCGEKKIVLTKDDFPYGFDTEDILKQALDSGTGSRNYEIRLKLDENSYNAIADKISAEADRKPENAKVTAFNADKKDMFTYQAEAAGLTLDKEDLKTKVRKIFDQGVTVGSVKAKFDEAKPEYTVEYLKQNIRKLSSFTTESTNTANGMSNQALSLAACSNSIIEPGATWSFNRCTGDTNLESRGYLPAGVIVQGRHEIGIGGGICQSSTTIYNAGLLCGMTVVERECHYYPSSYVDYGRDATIDYGNIDLKLKNPFKYQLFLKCWMDGVILHAEVYGLPAADFDEIKISTTEPSYTSTSYTVKASRTYYLNGKKVRTEDLPSSTYYFSAPTPDTPTPTPTPTTAPARPTTPPASEPPAPPASELPPSTGDEY